MNLPHNKGAEIVLGELCLAMVSNVDFIVHLVIFFEVLGLAVDLFLLSLLRLLAQVCQRRSEINGSFFWDDQA